MIPQRCPVFHLGLVWFGGTFFGPQLHAELRLVHCIQPTVQWVGGDPPFTWMGRGADPCLPKNEPRTCSLNVHVSAAIVMYEFTRQAATLAGDTT